MNRDDDKRLAALAAVEEVREGMVIGLGTGSTAAFAIDEIGRRCAAGLHIRAAATSKGTEARARAAGIPLVPFAEIAALDLAIDGADEVDPALRAIKGAGGAMLREKIIATAARRMIVIADGSKRVEALGAAPVPVEILPFAMSFVAAAVEAIGGAPTLRVAQSAPYRTDQDNMVLDCRFALIGDPGALAARLSAIPGVLGHGLFVDEVDAVYFAEYGTIDRIERPVVIQSP
jgi:ribose 5-phosphate isomerase A